MTTQRMSITRRLWWLAFRLRNRKRLRNAAETWAQLTHDQKVQIVYDALTGEDT